MFDLTDEEKRAINTLKRLAKRWPKSLWLFSASGTLEVMRCNENGERVFNSRGCVDEKYIVTDIGIPNDGGDW